MRRRKRKFKLSPKFYYVASAVFVILAAVWGLQKMGFMPRGTIGGLEMRPWRREEGVRRVGVTIERKEEPGPSRSQRPVREEKVPPREDKTPPPAPRSMPWSSHAKLAIILDDWGASQERLDDLIAIKRPITLAILPHKAFSSSIARAASREGLGVMLHMPMEAKGSRTAKESETISVDTPDIRIRRYLDEAIASVPGLKGVNNHQGSAATSDRRVMKTILSHLKQRGLFFIDSYVISTTVGPQVAEETGIVFAKRDVFIDNVAVIQPIKEQLRKAVQKALRNKTAIAIGHDKRVTIEAIRQMVPEIEKAGVRLVLAEELVK